MPIKFCRLDITKTSCKHYLLELVFLDQVTKRKFIDDKIFTLGEYVTKKAAMQAMDTYWNAMCYSWQKEKYYARTN